jgi:hypothetical protein
MNPGLVTISAPNKPRRRIERMEEPTLAELQEWVGGYIELVWRGKDENGERLQFIVDEEGLIKNLPRNPDGNLLFRETFGEDFPQILVGPCVVLRGKAAMT